MENFNNIYNNNIKVVERVAYGWESSFTGTMYDVEDLISVGTEIMWNIYSKGKYNPATSKFSTFLTNCIRNKYSDLLYSENLRKVNSVSIDKIKHTISYEPTETTDLQEIIEKSLEDKPEIMKKIFNIMCNSVGSRMEKVYAFKLKDVQKECNLKNRGVAYFHCNNLRKHILKVCKNM